MSEIRAGTVLPAKRIPVTLQTADGLRLVGELAVPADSDPVGTLICLHLDRWAAAGTPLVAMVPELDDYLRPDEARRRFARVPSAEVIAVDRAKHLWVGEPFVRIVLNEIACRVNPAALLHPTMTLPTHWEES